MPSLICCSISCAVVRISTMSASFAFASRSWKNGPSYDAMPAGSGSGSGSAAGSATGAGAFSANSELRFGAFAAGGLGFEPGFGSSRCSKFE